MTHRALSHRLDVHLRLEEGADERAPGAAVTVALCGHWDHKGPCRWPHFSSLVPDQDGAKRLVVTFDAREAEVDTVKSKIHVALTQGAFTGPDGVLSVWTVER